MAMQVGDIITFDSVDHCKQLLRKGYRFASGSTRVELFFDDSFIGIDSNGYELCYRYGDKSHMQGIWGSIEDSGEFEIIKIPSSPSIKLYI